MQKKAAAWSGEIPCEKTDIPHPLVSAVNLVYLLTSSLDCTPVIYPSADNELWAYYPNSCFVCKEFLENYGRFMAAAGITVYGGADGFESGELTASMTAAESAFLRISHRSLQRRDCSRSSSSRRSRSSRNLYTILISAHIS